MIHLNRIQVSPRICHGKPVIRGTRIMVWQVLDLLESGLSFEQIREDYFPQLTTADMQACLQYANVLIKQARVGKVESLKTFAKRHGVDIEDRSDARALKRAIRTSRGTITHRQLLQRLNKEDLEARPQKFLALLDASRKSGRVSVKVVKRKASLSSIAGRVKGRALPLRSIVREVQAYRRAKRTS